MDGRRNVAEWKPPASPESTLHCSHVTVLVNWNSNGGYPGMKGRAMAFVVTAAAAALILTYGIFREEIGEVMFNAAML